MSTFRHSCHPRDTAGGAGINLLLVILLLAGIGAGIFILAPYIGPASPEPLTEVGAADPALEQTASPSIAAGPSQPPAIVIPPMTTSGPKVSLAVKVEPPPATPPPISKKEKHAKNIDQYFSYQGPIPELKIELKQKEWDYLGHDSRRYVECTVIDVGEKTYKDVGVKLKGSAGSNRGPEDKPGLTLSFDKFKGAERFHGMEKLHLNNCAQDGTYLMEQMGGEIARAAGVPASRCTHAFVSFHGKDFGLYVLKEAFTKEFLAHFFAKTDGDLYDGGFVKEIDINMEKDQGDEKDRANLRELIDACNEANAKKNWARLEKALDIDAFLSFLAMESILAHWDGYNFNRNNYRLYFDEETGKARFFLHGMDQVFGDANFPAARTPEALVGQSVLANPEWKPRYQQRVLEIYEKVLKPIDWGARVTQEGEKIAAAWEKRNPGEAREFRNRIAEARTRITQRIAAVGKQLGDMPKPANFGPDNTLKITGDWHTEGGGEIALDEADVDGRKCLRLRANGAGAGSWRHAISLPEGRFRFEAQVRTTGVVPLENEKGRGALVRVSGANAQQHAEGETPWKTISFEFNGGAEVLLVAELRAQKGEAAFDRASLRIVWLKD